MDSSRAARVKAHHVRRRRIQVALPGVHELAPLLEKIRTRVGGLGLVFERMGKGRLADFARDAGAFLCPYPEARPEAVCRRVDAEPGERLDEPAFRQRPAAASADSREHELLWKEIGRKGLIRMVARGGIEPPTRGFNPLHCVDNSHC